MRRTIPWAGRLGAVVLLGLTSVVLAVPASASRRVPDTTDAAVALQSEVLALVMLGAFPAPLPPKVAAVASEWQSWTEGLDRDSLLTWLDGADADGAQALALLPGTTPLSLDVRTALERLPVEGIRALESGRPVGIPAEVYDHALNDLEARGGAAPAAGTGANGPPAQPAATAPPAAGPSASSPVMGTAPTTTPIVSPDVVPTFVPTTATAGAVERESSPVASRSSSTSALPLVIGGGIVLTGCMFGALVVLRRRDRDRDRERADGAGVRLDNSVARLFDASRRFSSSIESSEIIAILVEETRALVDADSVAVVTVGGSQTNPRVAAETPSGFVVAEHLDQGVVRRVIDTGTLHRSVVSDRALSDPAVAADVVAEPDADAVAGTGTVAPLAVLAVPLVRNGAIAGAVVASRSADRPFDVSEADLLGQLVPMAAAALVAAGRHDDVAELSLTDGLTELGNRRRLDRDLLAALAVGTGTVGFVMVDIDHFKHYNDTHGHIAGDEALQAVARLLRTSVRNGDVVYRYGGEEFCVLLPEATQREAIEVSERLRRTVEQYDFPGGELQPGGRLTISVGMTVADRSDPQVVKERADQALYEAKHRGRNQVVVDGD